MIYDYVDSPLGLLLLAADDGGLTLLDLPHEKHPTTPQPAWRRDAGAAVLRRVRQQLEAYFAGDLHQFTAPLRPHGTPFQCAVWNALRTIAYGHTTSYGELARRIDRPRAVRAVGAANGANPLAIIVPCHRVIGAHGSLTGYGGGLPAKRWLLAHERHHAPPETFILKS